MHLSYFNAVGMLALEILDRAGSDVDEKVCAPWMDVAIYTQSI